MARFPDDDRFADAARSAERLAGTVRRHVLAAAQASLRALRELLAQIPAVSGTPADTAHPDPATSRPTPRAHESGVRTRPVRTAPATFGPPPAAELLHDDINLPATYGSDRLVLLARDPHCLYAYWDLSQERVGSVRAEAGAGPLRIVLRAYDVTQVSFDANPPSRFQDFAVAGEARSLYAYVGKPAACFVAEVGVLRPDGAFFPFARSQPVWTPRTDQPGAAPGRWMTVGWTERRAGGAVMPLATNGAGRPEDLRAGGVVAAGTRSAPSSWPGPAPSSAQRGSWSLVRGKLATAERPLEPEDGAAVPGDP